MTKKIQLPHDYEVACPIRLEINRRGLRELELSAAAIYDWMSDSHMRAHQETVFTMEIPLPDDIIPNRYMIRHFIEGSYAPRYNDFLRWAEPLLIEQVPAVALAMREYERMQQQQELLH